MCAYRGLFLTLLVVVAVLFAAAGAAAAPKPDEWSAGPDAPWGFLRFDGHYYAPLNRVYFLGGRTGSAWTVTPDVRYFDVATSTFFIANADMPTGVSNYHIVELTDATGPGLFVIGGHTEAGMSSTEVQVYRPESDTAAVVAGDTWPGTVAMGCPSLPAAAVMYHNKAYLIGGLNVWCTPAVTAEVWIYDPMAPAGSRFTAGPPLTLARGYIQAAIVDNYLYALGGDEYPASLSVTPRTERLDLTNPSATWDDVSVAEMPTLAASGVAGCDEGEAFGFDTTLGMELAGKIVIPACGQWPFEYAESFIYDVPTNTWTDWEPLTTPRRNYAGTLVSSPAGVSIWVFGGRYGSDAGLYSSEYRAEAQTPTAVKLARIDSRGDASLPPYEILLAGVGVLALAAVVWAARHRHW